MTKEKALAVLNLFPPASQEEIEKAYQRLVRRYPREFHPEKFRALDEAYRFLTSLAFRIGAFPFTTVKNGDRQRVNFL